MIFDSNQNEIVEDDTITDNGVDTYKVLAVYEDYVTVVDEEGDLKTILDCQLDCVWEVL